MVAGHCRRLLLLACCYDGADAAATKLMLRAARVPPRGAAWQHLEEGRGGTSRGDASCAQHQLRRSSISSVAAASAPTRRAE